MADTEQSTQFPEFASESVYRSFLSNIAELPEGFLVSSGSISFIPGERPTLEPYRMNLSAIALVEPTPAFGGVFTRNAFPGAPVILARKKIEGPLLRAILVNNKISNVRAATGIQDAEKLVAALASELDGVGSLSGHSSSSAVTPEQLLSVSTGIIGWRLPVPEMLDAIPELVKNLHGESALDVADAIMTTDSFPKVRRVTLGSGSMIGIAKGAGMIEPNMATMLVFLLTDVTLERDQLRRSLKEAVDASFNRITVDSDQSTSDMAILLSSRRKPAVSQSEFDAALTALCRELAEDVVRNGEGTGHVIRVTVGGLPEDAVALAAAKAVVNSPLVKTAIYGNDPNVGRILGALGDFAGNANISIDPEQVRISVGSEIVYGDGAFAIDRDKEMSLSEYLKSAALNPRLRGYPQHQRRVELAVSCGDGPGAGDAVGADLSDQYVRENADYRT